jgi:hypothetical protein
VHPPAEAKKQWELGETVRVVQPDQDGKQLPDESLASELSDEVARAQNVEEPAPDDVDQQPDVARLPEPAPVRDPAVEMPEPEPSRAVEEVGSDDLTALFAALRDTGDGDRETPDQTIADEERSEPEGEEEEEEEDAPGTDWMAVRDERLIPITNRALRGVKKAMTEVQNVALDSLRTDEGWAPDEDAIAESVHAELVAVWSESFAAGHAVSEQMSGSKVKRPPTPASSADRNFATDLAAAVTGALQKAGEGPRERQSAASRVFRVWRSDEAERRIRDIALEGYEAGIEESRKVATG